MGGCLKGCFGRVVTLVAVVVAGVVIVRQASPDVWGRIGGVLAEARGRLGGTPDAEEGGAEPTPEMADSTMARFERFRAGGGPTDELLLGNAELSSVVRYSLPGLLPPGVIDPAVRMEGGRIYLSARVAVSAFPALPSLEQVVGLLPDTVPIRMGGSLGPRDASTAALYVDDVEAARIPLPNRFIPEILRALGREDRDDLPPNALLVPLPQGLSNAYVRRDSLVLVADG